MTPLNGKALTDLANAALEGDAQPRPSAADMLRDTLANDPTASTVRSAAEVLAFAFGESGHPDGTNGATKSYPYENH